MTLFNKPKCRATGSTLDYTNIVSLAVMWKDLVNRDIAVALSTQLEDKKSVTSLTLKQHDKNLFLLLRTWSQSTAIIAAEIKERLQEMEKIIKEHPEEYAMYLKVTGVSAPVPAVTSDVAVGEGGEANETH